MRETLYDYLEVSPEASTTVIRAAYRSLVQRYHPDRNPGDATAETRCKILNHAFETLTDPTRRAQYDSKIAAANHPQHGTQGHEHERSSATENATSPRPPPSRQSKARPEASRTSTSPPALDPVEKEWEAQWPLYKAVIAGKYADQLISAAMLNDESVLFKVAGWVGYLGAALLGGLYFFSGAKSEEDFWAVAFFVSLGLSLFSAFGHFVPRGRLIQQSRAALYYLKVFHSLHNKKRVWKDAGWWVVFVPFLWLPYRQQYGWALGYVGILMSMIVLEQLGVINVPNIVPFYLAVGIAVISNRIYFSDAKRRIRVQLHSTPDREEARRALMKQGGVRIWAAVFSVTVLLVGSALINEFGPQKTASPTLGQQSSSSSTAEVPSLRAPSK